MCLLLLGAYAYFYQAGGWNQNVRMDLTRALVERGTLVIDAYAGNTGDLAKKDGHFYCDKAPAISYLAVPPYAAVRLLVGEDLTGPALAWATWLCTVLVIGLPSVLAVLVLVTLVRRTGLSPVVAVGAGLAWGLGSLAWPYATLLYGHQLTAALLVIAFAILVGVRRQPVPSGRRQKLAAAGFLLGLAVAVEYPSALPAAVLGVYALATIGWRAALWLGLGALGPALFTAAYHTVAFGGPATLAYEFSTQQHRHMGFFMGLGVPEPVVLREILLGEYRGLLPLMPWLALAVPGAVRLWRSRWRAEVLACLGIVVLYLWLNASLVDWQGGWAIGPRYLVPMLPFMVWLAAGTFLGMDGWRPWLRRGLGGITVTLVAASALVMLVATAVKPEVPVSERRPVAGYLLPRFRAGQLGVSTQSLEMKGSPPNAPRAAWSLGSQLGLTGHADLVPLYVWLLGCGAGLALSSRRRTTQ
jgi:hypothetical protein